MGLPGASQRARILVVSHLSITRCLPFGLPCCLGAVPVNAHDGGIDHRALIADIFDQMLENLLPDAVFAPTRVTRMDSAEISEPSGRSRHAIPAR